MSIYGAPTATLSTLLPKSGHDDANCLPGKCTSWVDDALDAAGPEYADVPRPGSCCDKDAKQAKEAARVRRIVSAADPARRAAALRAASNPANVVLMPPPPVAEEDGDEDSDDLLTDDDEENEDAFFDEDGEGVDARMDPFLREIQERRLREMKAVAARAAADAAKASYVQAKEADLLGLINGGPSRVVAHFTLDGSDESARIDEALDGLAPAYPRTRFIRVRAVLPSPMLDTLGAAALPALICFRKRRLGRWTAGLDELGGQEGFDEERVGRWLAAVDMLPGHPLAPKPRKGRVNKEGGGGGGGALYSSSDEDERPGAALGRSGGGGVVSVEHGGDDGEDLAGGAGEMVDAGGVEPCVQCGRRYPHQHFRALRHGGERGRRGSDDDEDSD